MMHYPVCTLYYTLSQCQWFYLLLKAVQLFVRDFPGVLSLHGTSPRTVFRALMQTERLNHVL